MREKNITNYKTRYIKLLNKLEFYVKVNKEKLALSENYGLPVNCILDDFLTDLLEVIENETLCY